MVLEIPIHAMSIGTKNEMGIEIYAGHDGP